MPFTIIKTPRAWWPVKLDIVGEDGAIEKAAFDMRFRLLKVDEAVAIEQAVKDATAKELAGDSDLATVYAGLVERFADDWRHVLAENGEALSWSPANLRTLMNEPRLFTKVLEAFRDCLNAAPELREGN